MTASRVPTLTAPEGEALAVLDALLGAGRYEPKRAPGGAGTAPPANATAASATTAAATTTAATATSATTTPERARASALPAVASQRIARAVVRYVVDGGGHRERVVVRPGGRAVRRAWDEDPEAEFVPRFTSASYALWSGMARHLAALADPKPPTGRQLRKVLADLFPGEATDTGDWVFFAIAHENLAALRLPSDRYADVARRLRNGSPLAALMFPAPLGAEDPRLRFAPLFAPRAVRVLECVEARLVRAWTRSAAGAAAAVASVGGANWVEAAAGAWDALGGALASYVAAADAAGRLDLTRAVARFAGVLATRTFAQGGDGAYLVNGPIAVNTLAERDRLRRAAGASLEVARGLLRRRDEMATQRYGDERYGEAQVFVRQVDEELAPLRPAIDAALRTLSGVVG